MNRIDSIALILAAILAGLILLVKSAYDETKRERRNDV